MKTVKLYEGKVELCDQMTVDEMADNGTVECIFEAETYKEVLNWIIQALNDEYLDVDNHFYTIKDGEK